MPPIEFRLYRATTLQKFSAEGTFFSNDSLIFLLNQADDLGRHAMTSKLNIISRRGVSDNYFDILSKTRVKSSLVVLPTPWTEEGFRYEVDRVFRAGCNFTF